jgi:hypothetical protein
MNRYTICVTEHLICTYKPVIIEAANEDDAHKIAEEMRVQGELDQGGGDVVDDVDIETIAFAQGFHA